MSLLISWSGRKSHAVADALREWLPAVLHGIDPWVSDKDIGKGTEWFPALQGMLSKTQFCLICVTPENVHSPWIYYEVGAIALGHKDARIYPFLVGVDPKELGGGPLTQWQCTTPDREDTWLLIEALNKDVLDSRNSHSKLKEAYDTAWPDLDVILRPLSEAPVKEEPKDTSDDPEQTAWTTLSDEAKTMLVAVSKDDRGTLIDASHMGGTEFLTGGKNLILDQSPRTIARWKSALSQLETNELIEETGDDVFKITKKGYEYADQIEKTSVTPRPSVAELLKQLDEDVTEINFNATVEDPGPAWGETVGSFQCKKTLKVIFGAIGPVLVAKKRLHQIQNTFQEIVEPWARQHLCLVKHDPTGARIVSTDVLVQNLDKILFQFCTRGLVEMTESSASNNSPVAYWKLTPLGESVLSQIVA